MSTPGPYRNCPPYSSGDGLCTLLMERLAWRVAPPPAPPAWAPHIQASETCFVRRLPCLNAGSPLDSSSRPARPLSSTVRTAPRTTRESDHRSAPAPPERHGPISLDSDVAYYLWTHVMKNQLRRLGETFGLLYRRVGSWGIGGFVVMTHPKHARAAPSITPAANEWRGPVDQNLQ